MAFIAPDRNPSLYLLKDHLDTALALGEDLLAEQLALSPVDRPGLRDWIRQTRDLEDFLASLRTLEYALTARLMQARKRAEEMRRSDSRLKQMIALFVAGTVPLLDAAAELGDTDARNFDGTDSALAFLRSRGLLAPDAAGLELVSNLAVGEDYLVAGRIELGTLLDFTATFLDTLDLLYDFPAAAEDGLDMPAPGPLEERARHPAEPSAAN
ncbi:MAG: hypothetical protein J2P50_02115 [Hyphomicrobiaceae bacterium]|nr:hypothetical protein [Hyphomicrobiaceae bacterium]